MFTYNSNDGVFYIPCLWYMTDIDPEKCSVSTEKREGSTLEWEESRIPCILQKHLFKKQVQQINRNNNRLVVMDP